MDKGMRPSLEADEDECDDRQDNLDPLGTFLPGTGFASPPLSRRAIAKVTNPRDNR